MIVSVPVVIRGGPVSSWVEILSAAYNAERWLALVIDRACRGSLIVIAADRRDSMRKGRVTLTRPIVIVTLPVHTVLPNAALHFSWGVTSIPGLSATITGGT